MRLAIAAAVLLGGPLALIVWGLSRRYARDLFIESKIKPPRYTFTGQNDRLRERADRRKREAEEIRKRAALHAAGQVPPAAVRRFERKEA